MSESDSEEYEPGFEEVLHHFRQFVKDNPDVENAQSCLEDLEHIQSLTCTFCLGKYHTVNSGCDALKMLIDRFPDGAQNQEWQYLSAMVMNGQMSLAEFLIFYFKVNGGSKVTND